MNKFHSTKNRFMLSVNFQNLLQIYKFNRQSGLAATDLEVDVGIFEMFRNRVKSRNQGFTETNSSDPEVEKILEYSSAVEGKYEHFVILGIGGSMLGPKTVVDALASDKMKLKVICLDNIDPYIIESVAKRLNLSKTLFLVQTKSGGTPETIAQYVYFKDKVQKNCLTWQEHFVFVTDPKNGWLRQIAVQDKVQTFEVPENIGGRFSVLTPIGLLIAALVGLDIRAMLDGAKEIADSCYAQGHNMDAFKLALASHLLYQKGKSSLVIMPYNSRLKTFSEWCVQLLSESTGKQLSLDGREVFVGLTPIPALGATDQHSQLQLFKEGPHDKQFFFVETPNFQAKATIPSEDLANNPSLDYLVNQSFNSLIAAEFAGTRQSLTESLRPNITITMEKVDEYHLGALFMLFELYTAFLGEMLNIDTFNQPGVERSKVLTKEILSEKKLSS